METKDVYWRILKVVEHFLKSAKSNLTIEALAKLDPTLEEIAEDVKLLAALLRQLAVRDSYEDTNMALNAIQCCNVLERLVETVKCGDQDELDGLVEELEMHVNVP